MSRPTEDEAAQKGLLPLHNSEIAASSLSSVAATRQRKGTKQIVNKVSDQPTMEIYLEEKSKNPTWSLRRVYDIIRSRHLFRNRETLSKMFLWIQTYPRRVGGIVLLVCIIVRPSLTWKWYYTNFGGHYLNGGAIGKRFERWSMQQAFDVKLRKEEEQMRKLGIVLPPRDKSQDQPFREFNLRFDAAYRTLLVQRETRALALATAERNADKGKDLPFPEILFIPQSLHWVPPRPVTLNHLQRISFDDEERRQAVLDACPNLKTIFDNVFDANDKIQIWSLCMIFYYGGFFLGDRIQSPSSVDVIEGLVGTETSFARVHVSSNRINGLVATARHPIVKCILDRIGQEKKLTNMTDIFFLGHNEKKVMQLQCAADSTDCCQNLEALDALDLNVKRGTVTMIIVKEALYGMGHTIKLNAKVTVAKPELEDSRIPKIPIDSQLRQQRIQPSWYCMRCLMMPTYGRMSKCTRYCSPAYSDLVCRPSDDKVSKEVDVSVTGGSTFDLVQIPKIIHQTWFEEINVDRYPQLARLQNSWKNTGWEYRLYTDETAKSYIIENFPGIFAEAFDTLLPGAYKADFFRYLVLMKEGGVYADVDVLLETNLDHFIRPGLTFLVPRDVVAEYAEEAFCLWNGLIGAVPGHPIIVRAVERLVNLILERADIQDMERQICRKDKDTEVWKIHGHPVLFLSGPCGLGIAMNEVLGRSSLRSIQTGWTSLVGST